MDDAWLLLLDEAHTALAACNDSEAAFAVQSTASLLHVVGSSVRAAYVALSEAAKSRDPQAPAIAAERMDECPGWVRASDAFRNPRFRSFHAIQDLQRSVHAGKAGAPPAGVQAEGPHGDLNSPPLATVVTRQHPLEWLQAAVAKRRLRKGSKSQILQLAHSWRGSQHGAARRLWAVPMWAIFAVQYAVAVGIAVALTVTPPVLEKAFHNRSIEVCSSHCAFFSSRILALERFIARRNTVTQRILS